MGIEVTAWRAAIGSWAARNLGTRRQASDCSPASKESVLGSLLFASALVLEFLLIMGGIELNPGPKSAPVSIEDVMEKLISIESKLSNNIEALSNKLGQIENENLMLKAKVEESLNTVDSFGKKMSDMETRMDYIDSQLRRNNLIFFGISQTNTEHREDTENIIVSFLNQMLGIWLDDKDIDYAYRIGRGNSRPIVVRFLSQKLRLNILKRSKNLKGTQYVIGEDLMPHVRQKRKALIPHLKSARENGSVAFFRQDKLVIDGRTFNADDLSSANDPVRGLKESLNHFSTSRHSTPLLSHSPSSVTNNAPENLNSLALPSDVVEPHLMTVPQQSPVEV